MNYTKWENVTNVRDLIQELQKYKHKSNNNFEDACDKTQFLYKLDQNWVASLWESQLERVVSLFDNSIVECIASLWSLTSLNNDCNRFILHSVFVESVPSPMCN